MFKKVTQSIVNQMDPGGDLVPVRSILDQEHFQPLCLVRRKRKAMFQPSPCYKQTWYRLEDVLLPAGADNRSLLPSGAGQGSQQFTVQRTTSDKVDGSLNINIDSTNMEIRGAASSSKGWTIKLQKNHIPVPQLEAVKAERKVNMQHSFIQQLQRAGQDLYVVHESIETSEEANCEESAAAQGSLLAQLYAKFCAKGTWESKQSITIPKGCTLAFKAIQLAIAGGPWKVQRSCGALLPVAPHLPAIFLKAIKAVMRDRKLFEELSHKMDAVLGGADSSVLQTASSDLEELLSIFQHPSGQPRLAAALAYTLDALEELTEDQLLLLLESLDKEMVSQQLEMVSGTLAQEGTWRPFNMANFLSSFSQEEQALLTAMAEKSGVALQEDGSAVLPEKAFPAVAALYASLSVLDFLSN
ncbi:gasdermin-A [Dryobates pubescens]|uniref:gasdermin-A n=1 Tax=Dryobates pubescens TaxID=118200 RepID=UPI0023B93A46|nr:gasdermin-A [Dryobates pubescens]